MADEKSKGPEQSSTIGSLAQGDKTDRPTVRTDLGANTERSDAEGRSEGARNDASSSDAVRDAHDRMREVREAEEKYQADLNRRIHEARAAERERYAESEQGQTRAQQVEAERIMRLPTPEALEELGAVVGDPTRGPSA